MLAFDFIAYLIAAICFLLALLGVVARVNLIAAGLLAWILVPLVHTAAHLIR